MAALVREVVAIVVRAEASMAVFGLGHRRTVMSADRLSQEHTTIYSGPQRIRKGIEERVLKPHENY